MNGRILITIIKELNSKPKTSASELAQLLNVSKRTVYRYVNELTVNGIPINTEFGRYGGIYLDESYRKRKDKILV